jgi:hypothetical protein
VKTTQLSFSIVARPLHAQSVGRKQFDGMVAVVVDGVVMLGLVVLAAMAQRCEGPQSRICSSGNSRAFPRRCPQQKDSDRSADNRIGCPCVEI